MSNVPSNSAGQQSESRLTPAEEATRRELLRRIPSLADLYLAGLSLARGVEDGATGYLLAHAGRELSRGVLADLTGGVVRFGVVNAMEGENNRLTIATALELEPDHGLVTDWFRLVDVFSSSCHYQPAGVESEVVRSAFLRFSDLLTGLYNPYFDTQSVLDRLLTVVDPTPAHVQEASASLVRPQQRRYFFDRLQSVAWFESLAELGLFGAPPERVIHEDGSWQMRPWPEGKYLVLVASAHPARVAELLCSVSGTLSNPAVWITMVEVAVELPPVEAGKVALHLASALPHVPPVALPHEAIKLITHLAAAGQRRPAIHLADQLLAVHLPDVRPSDHTYGRKRARELLTYLDDYSLEVYLRDAVPALMRLAPALTIRVLLRKLNEVLGAMEESAAGQSRWWCSSLNTERHSNDVRQTLAASIAAHLGIFASTSSDAAATAWRRLSKREYTNELFQRLRLRLLADAGNLLPGQLNAAIGGDSLIDPPFGAREAADLLRRRFSEASPYARSLFAYALTRGPAPAEAHASATWQIQRLTEGKNGTPPAEVSIEPTQAQLREAIHSWQATRLRWFHDQIPQELQALAQMVGVVGELPSAKRQDLDEVGFHSGGVSWVGRQSPKSVDELSLFSDDELIAFLDTWEPTTSHYDGPSFGGLHEALTAFAAKYPNRAHDIASRLLDGRDRPGYITALLAGIRNAEPKSPLPSWDSLLALASLAIAYCDSVDVASLDPASGHDESGSAHLASTWHQLIREVIRLVDQACAKNQLDHGLSSQLWAIVTQLINLEPVWSDTWTTSQPRSLAEMMSAGLNSASGESTNLLIEAALWEYREVVLARELPQDRGHRLPEVEALVLPLLESVLARVGGASEGARTVIGKLLPQVRLVAPSFIATHGAVLFDRGSPTLMDDPVFGAYLASADFYDAAFEELRPTYLLAATTSSKEEQAEGIQVSRQANEGLARHLLVAVLRGLVDLRDPDNLAELAFSSLPAQDISHSYWEVFRGWSDTSDPIDPAIIQRLTGFWEWRVTALEAVPDSPERQKEAEGLLWFLMVPQVPAKDAIQLGRRTVNLNTGTSHTRGDMWERIVVLVASDPNGTFELIELLVTQELTVGYGLVPFDQVAPLLTVALTHGASETRERAVRLIHRLGERGHHDFGKLLMDH